MVTKLNAAIPVNRFLWHHIEQNGILSTNNYSGLRPIVPVQEVPEFMTILDSQTGIGTHPFIVYTWSKVNNGQMWFMKTIEVAYAIRSTDDDKTAQILSLYEELFQDYDEAGQRLNLFLQGASVPASYRNYDYKYIHPVTLGGPMPAEDENGPHEAIVSLRVTYTGG